MLQINEADRIDWETLQKMVNKIPNILEANMNATNLMYLKRANSENLQVSSRRKSKKIFENDYSVIKSQYDMGKSRLEHEEKRK